MGNNGPLGITVVVIPSATDFIVAQKPETQNEKRGLLGLVALSAETFPSPGRVSYRTKGSINHEFTNIEDSSNERYPFISCWPGTQLWLWFVIALITFVLTASSACGHPRLQISDISSNHGLSAQVPSLFQHHNPSTDRHTAQTYFLPSTCY